MLILCLIMPICLYGQTNEEKAFEKAQAAIKVMDEGRYDESIEMFKECEQLDPTNYMYPYEIALAYTYKKDYKKGIKTLKKVLKYKTVNNQVYQLLGNLYSMSGDPIQAVKVYEKGLKKFPNSGNLYLEKGNIYLMDKAYEKAIASYENGVKVDPLYPSNYFRLANLLLNSNNKAAGLIYGEIFMNLERTTDRTIKMSELLYNAYKENITIDGDEMKVKFCDIVIDLDQFNKEPKLPFCAEFESNLALALIGYDEINLQNLSEIRAKFIKNYGEEAIKKHPNVLFTYHQEMIDAGVFDAYNYYLFQIANQEIFDEWEADNKETYNKFIDWYIESTNILTINKDNVYLRE